LFCTGLLTAARTNQVTANHIITGSSAHKDRMPPSTQRHFVFFRLFMPASPCSTDTSAGVCAQAEPRVQGSPPRINASISRVPSRSTIPVFFASDSLKANALGLPPRFDAYNAKGTGSGVWVLSAIGVA